MNSSKTIYVIGADDITKDVLSKRVSELDVSIDVIHLNPNNPNDLELMSEAAKTIMNKSKLESCLDVPRPKYGSCPSGMCNGTLKHCSCHK